MKVSKAAKLCLEYHKSHSKENTYRAYRMVLIQLCEILKLTSSDINERRLTLKEPKSGREQEFIFIPQMLADRLKDYIREKGIQSHQRIFPICYEAAREMVAKAGVWWGFISGHMI